MRKLLLPIIFSLALVGCAGTLPSLKLNTSVSLNTILAIESAYGVALSGERTYKRLCQSGAITGSCRIVVAQLQAADLRAVDAIRSAVTFVKTYPTVDATNVIGAATNAIGELQSLLNSTGVH